MSTESRSVNQIWFEVLNLSTVMKEKIEISEYQEADPKGVR